MSYAPTAAEVKKLRDATGAGMMDCKRALTDAEGDDVLALPLQLGGASENIECGLGAEPAHVRGEQHGTFPPGVSLAPLCTGVGQRGKRAFVLHAGPDRLA